MTKEKFIDYVKNKRTKLNFNETSTVELVSFLSFYFAFPSNFITLIDTFDDIKSGLPNTLLVAIIVEELNLPL